MEDENASFPHTLRMRVGIRRKNKIINQSIEEHNDEEDT